jgi:hypothetical protein
MKTRFLAVIGVNLLVLFGLLLLVEGIFQVVAARRPAYDVLYLQPDRTLGWTQVPDLRYRWTGLFWNAADFSVDVEANALGFRDIDREPAKPPGVRRVALLGDSMIEAIQVPFSKTAGQLLEQKLNAPSDSLRIPSRQAEVLNFGISNYGVGQFLLTWEEHARRFDPDYVAVFVAGFHMNRTVNRYESGAFGATAGERLWIRPTFTLEHDTLVRVPARDYERFRQLQNDLIGNEFDGKRSRRKRALVTKYYFDDLKFRLQLRYWAAYDPGKLPPSIHPSAEVLALNVKLLEDLGRKVRQAGSTLIILDASRYFGDDALVAASLRDLSARAGFGYVPLSDSLMAANRRGVPTKWPHDIHFNEAGNRILAESLHDWLTRHEQGGATASLPGPDRS